MSRVEGLLAVRVVTDTPERFERTRDFYRALLGRTETGGFGDASSAQQAAFFQLGPIELIVTREDEPTPESKVEQGPVWLCFRASDPKDAHGAALSRGADLPNPPVATSFGSEAFFANDPMGLPVYVGTPWKSPRP